MKFTLVFFFSSKTLVALSIQRDRSSDWKFLPGFFSSPKVILDFTNSGETVVVDQESNVFIGQKYLGTNEKD
jgi:hypothetical protein